MALHALAGAAAAAATAVVDTVTPRVVVVAATAGLTARGEATECRADMADMEAKEEVDMALSVREVTDPRQWGVTDPRQLGGTAGVTPRVVQGTEAPPVVGLQVQEGAMASSLLDMGTRCGMASRPYAEHYAFPCPTSHSPHLV